MTPSETSEISDNLSRLSIAPTPHSPSNRTPPIKNPSPISILDDDVLALIFEILARADPELDRTPDRARGALLSISRRWQTIGTVFFERNLRIRSEIQALQWIRHVKAVCLPSEEQKLKVTNLSVRSWGSLETKEHFQAALETITDVQWMSLEVVSPPTSISDAWLDCFRRRSFEQLRTLQMNFCPGSNTRRFPVLPRLEHLFLSVSGSSTLLRHFLQPSLTTLTIKSADDQTRLAPVFGLPRLQRIICPLRCTLLFRINHWEDPPLTTLELTFEPQVWKLSSALMEWTDQLGSAPLLHLQTIVLWIPGGESAKRAVRNNSFYPDFIDKCVGLKIEVLLKDLERQGV